MIDEEWLAAGVTGEELARSRRAAWAMASSPSGRTSKRETVPRRGKAVAIPKRVPRRPAAGPPEKQHGERDHESFDRVLGLVDEIEAELEAIRVALGAMREALPDSAPSSPDQD